MIDPQTGQIVLTKPVGQTTTPLGNYQVLDFSAVRDPGTYVIKAGDTRTRSFRIGDDAWLNSIWKAINFMYSERCGTEIPGIHGRCHQDIYTIHDDKRVVVNGGYHDAGDLSATGNTPGMLYAFLSLADSLKRHGQEPVLSDRLLAEARWGLNWVLKTRFGDGYRSTGQLVSYWTDGIMGTSDDRFGQAVNNPEWNFRVSGVEALAARVLKDSDPELAKRSLLIAEEQNSRQGTTATSSPRDGEFNIHLPEGHYDVRQGSAHTSVTVVPGGFYDVDLRFDRVLDFKVTSQDLGHNQVVLRVSAEGAGRHTFTLRSDNLTFTFNEPGKQEMDLISGGIREAVWHAQVVSPQTPWVAVVIPDGTLSKRREVTGSENPHVLSDTTQSGSKTP